MLKNCSATKFPKNFPKNRFSQIIKEVIDHQGKGNLVFLMRKDTIK